MHDSIRLNKVPLPKNSKCHQWLKLAQRFWRRFSEVVKIFSICCYYLPLQKGQGPLFQRNLIPWTQGCSVPSLVEICPVVLKKKSSMYFNYAAIILLWQRTWSFIWTNLNHLHLGILYIKYDRTWLGYSEEANMWKDMDGYLDRQIDNKQRMLTRLNVLRILISLVTSYNDHDKTM